MNPQTSFPPLPKHAPCSQKHFHPSVLHGHKPQPSLGRREILEISTQKEATVLQFPSKIKLKNPKKPYNTYQTDTHDTSIANTTEKNPSPVPHHL